MIKTKEILILTAIFFIIMGLIIPVKAEGNTFKTEANANKQTIKPGDSVDVAILVKEINMGENGINTLEGVISYDKDLFEEVKPSDIKSANNWSTTFNDEGETLDGKFLSVTFNKGVKEDFQIISVTFKSKADIEETTTTKIEFKDLTSNDGNNLVNSGTKSVDVKIEVEKADTDPDDNKNNTIGNNTIEDNKNNTTNNSNNTSKPSGNTGTTGGKNTSTIQQNVDTTKSNSGLPKTGRTSFIAIAIVILVILLIFLGIKVKNMKGI